MTIICDVQNHSDHSNTFSELANITVLFVEITLLVNCYVKFVTTSRFVYSQNAMTVTLLLLLSIEPSSSHVTYPGYM